jgi:hypothetical protein
MPQKRQEVRCVETIPDPDPGRAGRADADAGKRAGPPRLEITEGVIEPLPFALPTFIAADGGATDVAQDITRVIAADLRGTGLFRQIPPDAYISQVTSFDSPVQYPDWQAINAQALITGEVETRGDGRSSCASASSTCSPGAPGRGPAIRGRGRKLAAHGAYRGRRGL